MAENKKLREQLNQARQDVEILQEAFGFCQAPEAVDPGRKHSFICAHLGHWPVAAMCRALGVSVQGGLPRPPAA